MLLFQYPLKTSENLWLFYVFRWYRKSPMTPVDFAEYWEALQNKGPLVGNRLTISGECSHFIPHFITHFAFWIVFGVYKMGTLVRNGLNNLISDFWGIRMGYNYSVSKQYVHHRKINTTPEILLNMYFL